ncbi:HEAT repeat domain-containing protein [Paenibacillus oenotherae]|uniref:HEAT repeat domain-containing protein n=1 Tax=Paenibacillus oenotherae TaxID=1435645 RepID=A0ABS7D662_9BACL|nr:HEAT repeat domain-containing protein [Paenibacillus oenotherae]MBW7475329.1 HEAT repeat domain-containing protein [Paenibacillus oenotherae]
MSVDLLLDLQQEVRRLFIAGSAMAQGDMRLAKLVPQLKKLGESAPVINRLAEAAEGLMSAAREKSSEKLLELATLLSAVLHTLGKTETVGETQTIEGSAVTLTTDVSYRKLQPLLEALTTKGQGRLEQLWLAWEDRSFLDLRALPALCRGLDDSYGDVPDYIQEKLIPGFGRDVIPVLQNQLNLNGGKGDSRRLQLLHRLLGESMIELLLEAAVSGSIELRAAAIKLLGGYGEQEPFLLEQTSEKRQEVRLAAYYALARIGSDGAVERLYEAIRSKDRELAVAPVRQCVSTVLHERIIVQAEEDLERWLSSEGEDRIRAAQQLHIDLRCLEGADKRLTGVVYPLLRKLLLSKAFIVTETETIQEAAAELLLELDTPEGNRLAIELQHMHNSRFIGYSFRAAYKQLKPSEVFDRFAGDLTGGSHAAKELLRTLESIVSGQLQLLTGDVDKVVLEEAWDPRWGHVFADKDLTELVCSFTHRNEPRIADYLISKAKYGNSSWNDETMKQRVLLVLFRIRHKEAPQLLLDWLEKKAQRGFHYIDWNTRCLISSMPKSYVQRLRTFAERQLHVTVRGQILEFVETIEAAPEETNEESGTGIWEWIKNKMS